MRPWVRRRRYAAVPVESLSPEFYAALVHWWKFDEASGTRADATGNLTPLTDNNTVLSDTFTFPGGRTAVAASFVATNSESLSHAMDASLQTADIDWALWGWLNIPTLADRALVFANDNTDANNDRQFLLALINATSKLLFTVFDGAAVGSATVGTISSASVIVAGQSYFFGIWHDSVANTVNIQLNNGAIASAATSGTPGPSSGVWIFGMPRTGASTFRLSGLLLQIGMTKNYIPTAAEWIYLYNNGNGRTYSDGEVV